jgi:drug/metabolite transporter (DMT)-like permease
MALGLGAGFSAGLCWVSASFGVNYLFERKSMKLFLINAGYHTLQFTVIGLILALWPVPPTP